MIIEPKVRGFICTTSHPVGCAVRVQNEINLVKNLPKLTNAPKRVLIIGASTGYGLSSRIVSAFVAGASTIGVSFERPADTNRTATAGWYNTAAFERFANNAGYYAKSINGDAFSNAIKEQTIELIKKDLKEIDLVVYSLASPRRIHPKTGVSHNSVLRPIAKAFEDKTINTTTAKVTNIRIEAASEEDIKNTTIVMGGEDWEMWIDALSKAGVLAKNAVTVAYSYMGPSVTEAIYRKGTIGQAKIHLEETAKRMTNNLNVNAYVSVNKALVTQASSAIPVIPLYISLLFKVMKEKNIHEDCIEQIYRLFAEHLYSPQSTVPLDENGLIRIDDWEMRNDVQEQILALWKEANDDNISKIADLEGYQKAFLNLFGFDLAHVNYQDDVNIFVNIPSIS